MNNPTQREPAVKDVESREELIYLLSRAAELEHGHTEEADEKRKGHRLRPKNEGCEPDGVDGDKADQRAMRQPPHPEPANKPRVEE